MLRASRRLLSLFSIFASLLQTLSLEASLKFGFMRFDCLFLSSMTATAWRVLKENESIWTDACSKQNRRTCHIISFQLLLCSFQLKRGHEVRRFVSCGSIQFDTLWQINKNNTWNTQSQCTEKLHPIRNNLIQFWFVDWNSNGNYRSRCFGSCAFNWK